MHKRTLISALVGLLALIGALLSGGLDRAEQTPPRLLSPDERCDALPGERCECWVAPW